MNGQQKHRSGDRLHPQIPKFRQLPPPTEIRQEQADAPEQPAESQYPEPVDRDGMMGEALEGNCGEYR